MIRILVLLLAVVLSSVAEPKHKGYIVKYKDGTVKLKREISKLSVDREVEYIEPNYVLRKTSLPKIEPDDPHYPDQWFLRKSELLKAGMNSSQEAVVLFTLQF